MRHSLGTIAWRGLKGRRRDTAMMLCVLAAVFALLTAVLCYQQSGNRAMEVQRQELYGAWQLARYDLTAADADAFVQQTAPAAVGRAAQYAALVNDKDLAFGALGTVDEGYLACGQLQLLSGRLPGTAGEAALTTSVLDSIGASYELGQTVTLQAVHGDDAPVLLQFTLCGVLPSYDAYWAVGSNLPVDALVTADSLPQSWDSKIQLLCCYAGAVPLAPYIDGSQDPTWVRNTYAYPEADLTRSGSWAFMGGCALLTLCAVLVLCTLQLRRREQSLVTLRMIGAGKTALVALCLWEAVFLLLFCLPIGSLLGVGLCAATLAVQGHVRYLSLPWGQLALAWATGTGAVLLGFLLIRDLPMMQVKALMPDWGQVKAMMRFSIVMLSASATSMVMSYNETFIVGQMLKNEELLAEYRVAANILSISLFLLEALLVFILPYFIQHIGDCKWIWNSYKKLFAINGVVMTLFHLGLFLFAKLYLYIFAGPEYMGAAPLVRMFLIASWIQAVFRGLSGNILAVTGEEKFNLKINIILADLPTMKKAFSGTGFTHKKGVIVHAVIDIAAVKILGIYGAAIALIVVYLLSGLIMNLHLRNICNSQTGEIEHDEN